MQDSNSSIIELSIVIPVYKEEANILPFLKRLIPVVERISEMSEIIFILDPSPDQTEKVIIEISTANPRIKLIKMSRRFGQPAATMAGLGFSSGKRVVVIDVDLQDPPEVILELNKKWMKALMWFTQPGVHVRVRRFLRRSSRHLGIK